MRFFNHHIRGAVVLLGALEASATALSAEAAWQIRLSQLQAVIDPVTSRIAELFTFSLIMALVMIAVGLYHSDCFRSLRTAAVRLTVALVIGLVALSVIFFLYPDVATWRSVFLYALVLTFVSVLTVRYLFIRVVGLKRFQRRVLVLGAGERAAPVRDLAGRAEAGFMPVAFMRMGPRETVLADAVDFADVKDLNAFIEDREVEEVVLALDERRGTLPIAQLVSIKVLGTRVAELSTFFERETGRVDLDSLNPSWLVLSEGFQSAGRVALLFKRLFDVVASALLLIATAPLLVIVALVIKLTSPGPIFYRQERVGQFGRPFQALKFRSMRQDAEKDGTPQWAAARDPRVTAIGRFIRATRIDEIPQIFNVFAGDMSFVGPRPERPYFVKDLSQQIPLYDERHVVKPGITGWAQVNYPYGASVEDSRRKLEYDLYYVKNYSLFLDILILIQTARVVLLQDGSR